MSGGILPLFTNVNATPLWGAGGGGGSVGPDLTVSTLTVAPSGPGIKLMNAAGNASANITGYRAANASTNDTILSVVYPSGYIGPEGLTGVFAIENIGGSGAYYGDFASGRLIVLGQNAGSVNPVPIIDAGTNSDLVIAANTSINLSTPTILQNGAPLIVGSNPTFASVAAQNYMNVANQNGGTNNLRFESLNNQTFQLHVINGVGDPGIRIGASNNTVTINDADLQVTTINGAPYVPGGISADPIVSTLRAFPGNDPQASVYIGGTPNNVVAIRNGSTLQSYIDLDLRDAGGVSTDLARTNLSHDYGITTVYSQNAGANFKGSIAILSSINGGSSGIVLDGANNSVLTIGGGTVQTSSFTVSSINGTVYPPPSIGASTVGLSNFSVGLASVPGGNNAYPLSQDFNIQNGKTYRISGNFAFENGEAATHTDLAVVGGGAGFPAYITSFQNGDAIPANNGLAGGYGTVFLATSDATCQVVAYNTATTTSTIVQTQTLNAKWVLENLGTI